MKSKILLLFALLCGAVSLQAADTKVVVGAAVKFTVTVDGSTPLTYTWQKAPVGSTTFTTIAGQTGAVYTIAAATAGDAGNYRVIVANDYGTTTSTTATINAGAAPNIINFGIVVTPPPAPTP